MKWVLDWCADTGLYDEIPHDKEILDNKRELRHRLQELYLEFGDDLEFSWKRAKKVKTSR